MTNTMVKSRQEINRVILEMLSDLNENHSDLRFGQLLCSSAAPQTYFIKGELGFEIDFYEESIETLERMMSEGLK